MTVLRGFVHSVVLLLAWGQFFTGCGDVTTDLLTAREREPSQADVDSTDPAGGPDVPGPGEEPSISGVDAGTALQPCSNTEDCTYDDQLICHPSTKRCVECVTDGHCEDVGERCSAVLGECAIPCTATTDCTPDDPICDLAIGFCVECERDNDCRSGELCRRSECVRP